MQLWSVCRGSAFLNIPCLGLQSCQPHRHNNNRLECHSWHAQWTVQVQRNRFELLFPTPLAGNSKAAGQPSLQLRDCHTKTCKCRQFDSCSVCWQDQGADWHTWPMLWPGTPGSDCNGQCATHSGCRALCESCPSLHNTTLVLGQHARCTSMYWKCPNLTYSLSADLPSVTHILHTRQGKTQQKHSVDLWHALSWNYHESILELSWKFHGTITKLSLHYHGTILEWSWHYHGTIMALVWNYHGTIRALSWNYQGTFMELPWHFPGTSMELSRSLSWNLAGHFHGSITTLLWSYYRSYRGNYHGILMANSDTR